MDPNACFSMILENLVLGDWNDAAENAESLHHWMQSGGFEPGGGKLRTASINELVQWLINHPERDHHDLRETD